MLECNKLINYKYTRKIYINYYTSVTFKPIVDGLFSGLSLKELLVVLRASRKSKLATASFSFSPYLIKKSGLPIMVGLLFGIAALTTANSGLTAWAGRQYTQSSDGGLRDGGTWCRRGGCLKPNILQSAQLYIFHLFYILRTRCNIFEENK